MSRNNLGGERCVTSPPPPPKKKPVAEETKPRILAHRCKRMSQGGEFFRYKSVLGMKSVSILELSFTWYNTSADLPFSKLQKGLRENI